MRPLAPCATVEDLTLARRLADAAFDAWTDVQGRDDLHDEVGMGADGTPTSRVDRFLDEAILDEAADLGVGVVSEETGRRDGEVGTWAYVDPLDGSRNAGRGIPFFCTSIAVAHREGADGLRAGVVRNLVTGDVYDARRGGGFRCNGRPFAHRGFDADEVMVALIADSSVDDVQREQQRRGHHIRDLGSAAMELSLVATGALDAFIVRKDWLRNVDIAAGMLIVEEAGGVVEAPGGGPADLTFDVTDRLGLVAAHGPEAMEAVR